MNRYFLYRYFDSHPKGSRDILIAYFSAPYFDSVEFDSVIQREIEYNLAPDEILIILRQTAVESLTGSLQSMKLKSLMARLPNATTITAVGFDASGAETSRQSLSGPASSVEFSDFVQRALTDIFIRRGGFVEGGPTYHFKNPSGRHTDRFMRIANVLSDAAEISFFAFATLPWIPKAAREAYVDTPGLYALTSALNDHYRSLDASRILSADNFGSYSGIDTYSFPAPFLAVFLISASTSGSLVSLIRDKLPLVEDRQLVSIVYLGKKLPTGSVVCNLSKSSRNPQGYPPRISDNREGACSLCDEGSVAIPLRGDHFEITGPAAEPVMIALKDAPPGLDKLMDRTAGQGIFRVGFNESRSAVPRHYHTDFEAILRSTSFNERLKFCVVRFFPNAASCIVCVDPDARKLADKILEYTDNSRKIRVLERSDLGTELDSSADGHVVIAASVIESGRSLLEVSRDLRTAYPRAPQTYFVGFGKLESAEKLRTLTSTLTKTGGMVPHGFQIVEEMVLPPSGGRNAWSRERDLYRSLDTMRGVKLSAAERSVIDKRLGVLEVLSTALADDIFLPSAAGSPLALQFGFVFWSSDLVTGNHSQADIYFTISSVLQSLREQRNKPLSKSLRNDFFMHNVLDPGIFGRFNDGVIQASFLRAAQPHELNYSDAISESREAARIVGRVLEGSNNVSGAAAAEFLLALATGTLELRKSDLLQCLSKLTIRNHLQNALLKMIRRQISPKSY